MIKTKLAQCASCACVGQKAAGNQTITLTSNNGSGVITTSAASNNTLRAVYNGNLTVQLSMLDNGAWPSLVGDNTTMFLAHGSMVTTADVSPTLGAVVIGNNHTNYIRGSGSFMGDTVSVGSGLTYLIGGTTNASLVINYPDTTVVWNDYDQQEAAIYVAYGRPDPESETEPQVSVAIGAHRIGTGTQLTINKASVVQLPGVPRASFSLEDAVDWASNDGVDYSIPVPSSSSLEPVYLYEAPPPPPPSPSPTPSPMPIPRSSTPPSPSSSSSDGGGFECGSNCHNVPGYSGWVDTNFP